MAMPMFNRTKTCSHCGAEIPKDAKFCPVCGEPTDETGGKCPYCGAKVAANAKFCPECGRNLTSLREPAMKKNVWRASPDELAVRIEAENLKGRLFKDIEIQLGQQALLLVDGRALEERMGPGKYAVKSFLDWMTTAGRGRHVTALLVKGSPAPLEFSLKKLHTRDNYEVGGRVVVGIQVANPATFFAKMMQGQDTYTLNDLRQYLFDQVWDAAQDVIRRQDLKGLAEGLAMKDQINSAIAMHLEQTLADTGLTVTQVQTARFSHPRYDAVTKTWEDIRLNREEVNADITLTEEQKAAELRKRKMLFEAETAGEDQTTAEQREKSRIFEERAQVWERMRQALNSERMNQIRSEEDFADFLAEIDKNKVLRQEDLEIFKEEYANRKEDRHAARAQLIYLAGLERDYERKRAELAQRSDFTLEQMAAALKIEQQKLVDAGLMDETRWENEQTELLRDAERGEWQRTEQLKWDEFNRERVNAADVHRRELEKAQVLHKLELHAIHVDEELSEAQKRAKVDVELARYDKQRREILLAIEAAEFDERIRREKAATDLRLDIEAREDEQDMKTADAALDLLKKMKQTKLDAEARAREIARQDELERQKAAHEQAMEKERLGLEAEAQKQAHELAMLQARAEMSAEALISLSGPDQAKVLADLKQTEALKDLSDEQVYAMMAAKSPQVAAALAERFKAMQDQPDVAEAQLVEVKALYERMIADIQKDKEREAELRERTEQRYQEMFNKALDSQRDGMVDIARATSHPQTPPSSPSVVVVPPGGSPQVINPGGGPGPGVVGGEVQVCPKCHTKMPVGTKFCTNCGYKFFE